MRYAAIIFSFLFIQIAAAQDYIFIDSDEGNGPVYEWIDIIELVNQLESPQEDDYTGPFDIGFEFPFYENTFDQFYVGSNGMIGFVEEGMANQINHELPDPGIPNNVIAWFWDDMDPAGGEDGQCYYQLFDDEELQYAVILFQDWDQFPSGPDQDNITAQVVLYSDGRILIQYAELTEGLDRGGCTIGVENSDGSDGTTYAYNNEIEVPSNEMSILFIASEVTVTGTIREELNGIPIPGAEISAGETTVESDENGVFSITVTNTGWESEPLWIRANGFVPTSVLLPNRVQDVDVEVELYDHFHTFVEHQSDFEDDLGGFIAENVWEHGVTTENPDEAHSGENVWATVLNGEYPDDTDARLEMENDILLTGENAWISYWHWMDFSNQNGYNVDYLSQGGEEWETLEPMGGYNASHFENFDEEGCFGWDTDGWQEVYFELGELVDEEGRFSFDFRSTDNLNNDPGVAIDDVEIRTLGHPFTYDFVPQALNVISFPYRPSNYNAMTLFSRIPELELAISSTGGYVIPRLNINTIGDINLNHGYGVFLAEGQEWGFRGKTITELAPDEIEGNRWNLIGYPYDYGQDIDEVLGEYQNDIAIVQADDGRMWIPAIWLDIISPLVPGEGYYLYPNDPFTLQFPGLDDDLQVASGNVSEAEANTAALDGPFKTGQPYTLVLKFDQPELLSDDLILNAYDDELLVGRASIRDLDGYNPMVIWKGAEEYNLPGYIAGNPITVELQTPEGNRIASQVFGSIHPDTQPYTMLTFSGSGEENILPSEFTLATPYPNPFNGTLSLSYSLPLDGNVEITVFNTLGQKIETLLNSSQPRGNHRISWHPAESELSSGLYLFEVHFGEQTLRTKAMYIR
ncbi:T9SS type A sorting domain-containing protein [bacterium]|nr:T9SS type A sorting domain-containing protein [bacterium]